MPKNIISTIDNMSQFNTILQKNPGLFIVKFGATWCGPCKQIAHIVDGFFATSPQNVICADLDVDESFELYGYLKSKKMVNGIPVMLMYRKDKYDPKLPFIPTDSCTGADPVQLDQFFKRCGNHLAFIEKMTKPKKSLEAVIEDIKLEETD